MSGDRLARIERNARSIIDPSRSYESASELGKMARDVLTLVEIAKAARVAMASVDDTDFEDAVIALRLALARLDSGATEGDA